jgi:hypothetical protein
MSLKHWLVVSIWLATNCFAFDMSNLCYSSLFIIPSSLAVTALHHAYMFRYIRRNPDQLIPRKYIYTLVPIILLWLAGGAMSIVIGALSTFTYTREYRYYKELASIVSSLIAGVLSVVEAGLIIVIWRKCGTLKANGVTGIHPLASLDNLDR